MGTAQMNLSQGLGPINDLHISKTGWDAYQDHRNCGADSAPLRGTGHLRENLEQHGMTSV